MPTERVEREERGSGRTGRRKKVTRDQTNTLKGWLVNHLDYPYPKREDKWILCILTKLTMDQVSTWFANARRRLKKEKGVTWNASGRNKSKSTQDPSQSNSPSTSKMQIQEATVAEEEQIKAEREDEEGRELGNEALDGRVFNIQPPIQPFWNYSHHNSLEGYPYGKLNTIT